ncbi:MAG TPA: hypothetical protein VF950_03940 [Planctomycetota bacterium]
MRLLVPGFVLVLAGAAWLTRPPATPRPAAPARPAAEIARVPASEPAAETRVARSAAEPAAPTPAVRPATPVPAPKPQGEILVTALLRGELNLSDEQKLQVERILEDRRRDVAAYATEVRQRGWIRLAEFEVRIAEIRELSYDRMAALLDTTQALAFATLRVEMARKDFLSIAIPEDEVVSLD